MIISHKYRFIFLKTNKTAGTSIEIALSKHCGEEDIITPIARDDEKLRRNLGYPGPQNYLYTLKDLGIRSYISGTLLRNREKKYYNHITAREVKSLIGDEIWKNYFKFCVERNPFDRVISHYFYFFKREPRPSLSEYLNSEAPLVLKKLGYELYTIGDEIAVDRICKFENLNKDLEEIRLKLGIPEPLDLPLTKTQYRKDKRACGFLLGEEEKSVIKKLFKSEIEMFGYQG